MTALYFYNDGQMDIRGATIAGLSAKETDSPIGLFGTGLKYGIACVLRWGGQIAIRVREDSSHLTYRFGAQEIEFRGKTFSQVFVIMPDGTTKELGFTTEYGKQWEPWQVFREFYANALDEGGGVERYSCPDADTVLEVHCPALLEAYNERDKIILPSIGQIDLGNHVSVVDTPATALYYRGVRVASKTTRLTYNVHAEMKLTEDRTLADSYRFGNAVGKAIQQCTEPRIIEAFLTAHAMTYEVIFLHDMLRDYHPCSQQFLEVAARLFKRSPGRYKMLKSILLMNNREEGRADEVAVKLNRMQEKMLERAEMLVDRMGLSLKCSEVEISVVDLGKETLGKAENGKVFLSPLVFQQGTKQVVSTLYEELLHLSTGLQDCNYEMQTHLFNTIVSLYEEHVFGEPC